MKTNPMLIIPLLLVLCACGDATPDPTTGASLSLSAAATFDASGTWKVDSTTCDKLFIPGEFNNSVTVVSNDVQTFVTPAYEGNVNDAPIVILSSEGTLNAQTGAYKLCYTSTLADCSVSCTGTVDTSNSVALNCINANDNSTCAITLSKQQ